MYYFELKAHEIWMMDEDGKIVSVVMHEPVDNDEGVKYTIVKNGKAHELTGEVKNILNDARVEHLRNIVKFVDVTRSKKFAFAA